METLRVHRDFLALGLESMKKGYSFQSISDSIPDRAPFFPENGKIQIAVNSEDSWIYAKCIAHVQFDIVPLE